MQGHEFPATHDGQTIGLLGGSFDPAHEGHVHVSETALRAFGIDRVWWLVSPGNPLKDQGPAPLEARMSYARTLVRHPKIDITGVEAGFGTRYTAETLNLLVRKFPRVRFVWLMGADNLSQFHLWKDWEWIGEQVPIGVVSRPNSGFPALNAPFSRKYRYQRLAEPIAGVGAYARPGLVFCPRTFA